MIEEGRFEDIYVKYGISTYTENIAKMQQKDIFLETGSRLKGFFGKTKATILYKVLPYTLVAGLSSTSSVVAIDSITKMEKYANSKEYAKQIENYNDKIEIYAEEVKSMNLTDIQIFMKVMKDMWEEIDGYKTPEKEVQGFFRLTLDAEGVGVCRNFADDMTAKLNAIDSKYNARDVVVYMNKGKQKIAKIKRTILENNETVMEKNSIGKIDFNGNTGNHMITAVDIQDKKITLLLDPTNPSIGVFKNGEIYMFSSKDGKGIETRKIQQFIVQGLESTVNIGLTELKSFLPCEYSIEELEKLYGIDAQNKALKDLEKLEEEKSRRDFIINLRIESQGMKERKQETNKKPNRTKYEIEK